MNKFNSLDKFDLFLEWIWSKFPDKCRQPNCPRTGVRGNENWVEVENGRYEIMCDSCTSHWLETHKPL